MVMSPYFVLVRSALGEQTLDLLLVGRVHVDIAVESVFAIRGLRLELVLVVLLLVAQPARAGLLEPLGGGLRGLHLRHHSSPDDSGGAASAGAGSAAGAAAASLAVLFSSSAGAVSSAAGADSVAAPAAACLAAFFSSSMAAFLIASCAFLSGERTIDMLRPSIRAWFSTFAIDPA